MSTTKRKTTAPSLAEESLAKRAAVGTLKPPRAKIMALHFLRSFDEYAVPPPEEPAGFDWARYLGYRDEIIGGARWGEIDYVALGGDSYTYREMVLAVTLISREVSAVHLYVAAATKEAKEDEPLTADLAAMAGYALAVVGRATRTYARGDESICPDGVSMFRPDSFSWIPVEARRHALSGLLKTKRATVGDVDDWVTATATFLHGTRLVANCPFFECLWRPEHLIGPYDAPDSSADEYDGSEEEED